MTSQKLNEGTKKSIENPSSYRAMATVLKKMPEEDIHSLLRIHSNLLAHLQGIEWK